MNKTHTIERLQVGRKISFNDRIVDFSKIHNHKEQDWIKFLEIIDPRPGEVILSGMDGYGAPSQAIWETSSAKGFVPEIYALDESPVQIARANADFPQIPADHRVTADMRRTPFDDGMFDTVVIKMGLHEVPKLDQVEILREVRRILKPGGKFVTWDLSFHDVEVQKVFQDLIRKKDEIAGFDSLVSSRYFSRQDELLNALNQAGFEKGTVAHEVDARLTMRVRESELVSRLRLEFQSQRGILSAEDELYLAQLGKERCTELVNFAKQYMATVPSYVKDQMHYEETVDDIKLIPNKEIIVGYKPQ